MGMAIYSYCLFQLGRGVRIAKRTKKEYYMGELGTLCQVCNLTTLPCKLWSKVTCLSLLGTLWLKAE